MNIEQTARRLRAREISAVELARESLKTIHAEQPRLNAFITITEETALGQALRADTGGSIRIPAAYCGGTVHKPTYGIVSRYGCMALGNNLDHMGPLAATPRDAALVMAANAGYDSREAS